MAHIRCLITMIAAALVAASATAQSPTKHVKVILLNGRTGHPMPGERVLFFFEAKADQPTHEQTAEVRTGADGTATLTLPLNVKPFLQSFVDFRSVCWDQPNLLAVPVQQIVTHGALTPNTCGNLHPLVHPGELIIFARPATLREKMDW